MSLRRHVCRLPLHLKPPKDYIWISEDILDNAINHFSHGKISKRHVGLAPGPLESRKRAAKRRMVNLAQVGGGGDLDPGLFNGAGHAAGQNHWQWQNPALPVAENTDSIMNPPWIYGLQNADRCAEPVSLPRWLDVFDSRKVIDDQSRNEEEDNKSQRHEHTRADPSFLEDLKACQDLDDLSRWITKRGVDLRQYSRLAFRQLSDVGSPIPTLLQALEDPALSTPGNVNYFLARRLAQPLSQTDALLLGQWIKKQFSLGLWSENEISALTHSLSNAVGPAKDEQLKCNIIESLLEGLQSSTVFNIQDVNSKVLTPLLDAVHQWPISCKSQDLGIRIIKALQPSQLEQMEHSISLFITDLIRAQASLHISDKQDSRPLDAVPRAIETLRWLPRSVACSVIMRTSRALINDNEAPEHTKSGSAMLRLLANWWSSLAKNGLFDFATKNNSRKTLGCMLADKPIEIIAPYLRHLDDMDKVDIILRRWLANKPYLAVMRRLQHLLHGCKPKEAPESPFVVMLRVLQQRALLSDNQVKQLFRLLQKLGMSNTIIGILKGSTKDHIKIGESVVLHTIRTHMKVSPEMAQRIFCAYPQLPLESCPDFAETLIANPRIHPGAPLHCYQSQRPGRKAAACREPLRAIKARARLLERMAVAYSRALHLSPRVAFDKIYICYKCHMSESLGPISRGMILAFTDAGVIRPLQQRKWVSTVKLRWILSLIRSVESDENAEQVDSLVYQWRGLIIRKLQERQRSTSWNRLTSSDVPVNNHYSWRWRRYMRTLNFRAAAP